MSTIISEFTVNKRRGGIIYINSTAFSPACYTIIIENTVLYRRIRPLNIDRSTIIIRSHRISQCEANDLKCGIFSRIKVKMPIKRFRFSPQKSSICTVRRHNDHILPLRIQPSVIRTAVCSRFYLNSITCRYSGYGSIQTFKRSTFTSIIGIHSICCNPIDRTRELRCHGHKVGKTAELSCGSFYLYSIGIRRPIGYRCIHIGCRSCTHRVQFGQGTGTSVNHVV